MADIQTFDVAEILTLYSGISFGQGDDHKPQKLASWLLDIPEDQIDQALIDEYRGDIQSELEKKNPWLSSLPFSGVKKELESCATPDVFCQGFVYACVHSLNNHRDTVPIQKPTASTQQRDLAAKGKSYDI